MLQPYNFSQINPLKRLLLKIVTLARSVLEAVIENAEDALRRLHKNSQRPSPYEKTIMVTALQ